MGSGSATLPAKRSVMSDPTSLNGSSKRSKKPPSSQQQQQQPLVVPPGHVAFRLLCHASRIGGVIGKAGSVIKQLQQATGSKIRVENAPEESPDRVVAVVAPSSVVGKISLKSPIGGDGFDFGGGEEMDASKAQEALLRVFDRILEVAAETGAVGASIGVVSCRLLVDAAQAGSVIGKGGKIVEKIRKDCGCKIRVLTEMLPACADSTDEMIEIEGSVLAVKKGLVAVSRRVQDCPSVDKSKAVVGSRQLETLVPQEALPDLRMEHLSHRNLMMPTYTISSLSLPTSSIGYVSGVRPLALESERIPAIEEKVQQQEVSFRILCENARIGSVIGKGGSVIRALQNDAGANVSVGVSVADCDERLITISASENPESRYSPAQKAVVLVFSRFLDASSEKGQDSDFNKGSSVTARLVVPSNQVGCLLGKGGSIVSEMRKVTGANIRVIGGDQVPKCATEKDVVVQISGDFSSVQDALYNATGRLRDNLLSSIVNSAATRNASTLLTNTSPYARMRDPAPPTINTSPPIGVHSFTQHSTLGQRVDHLGLSHALNHSSPRQWESQMMAGISTRGFSEAGGGFSDAVRGLSEAGGGFSDAVRGFSESGGGFSDAVRGYSEAGRGFPDAVRGFSDAGGGFSDADRGFSDSGRGFTDAGRGFVDAGRGFADTGRGFSDADRGFSDSGRDFSDAIRGFSDASRALSSLKGGLELAGSGSKSAIVTNTTVEIIVPENAIGSVYGENGNNLTRLRQISGARVIVHEPRPGTSDRIIVISGTPDETQAAQSLLHAFILTGPS
ncbi:KH domain-containing protein HEN4 isoform X1 [Cannabis sativa]|uniref:KH domain-containing protein HEN4 isoform X1 n=1 Tax=Cannabis sativa TaxID=3483 RepID=UPI0029CA03AF|nr:KH domain-containing protein HEN4 isoform X1 [Cannabis sativa]